MSNRTNLVLALALSLSGASACDDGPTTALGEIAPRCTGNYCSGGTWLNTSALGDHMLAQFDSNFGNDLDGIILDQVVITRYKEMTNLNLVLDKVNAKDGVIFGVRGGWNFSGADFIDSKWTFTFKDLPDPRTMIIKDFRIDPLDGLPKYTFMYPDDENHGPHPLLSKEEKQQQDKNQDKNPLSNACSEDPDLGFEAVVINDLAIDLKSAEVSERPGTLRIACFSGADGKSVHWGYRPWLPSIGALGHQQAIRVVRADYCGDGTSWTHPGNALTLEDNWSINTHPNLSVKTEAIWSPKGAQCIGLPRDPAYQNQTIVCQGIPVIPCKDLVLTDFGPDADMWSKSP